ncbi:ROK family protein [Pseudotabrizicola formosa]|uniref:ROK family protein n=1 Tax=Pseudotabrizicola formosa TaxID=2030009 RepID=UPI001FEFD955|nr:ROK family protein [Pseudotabrizicola formosa]
MGSKRLAVVGNCCQAMAESKRGRAMILCFDIGGSRIKAAVAEAGRLDPLGDCPTPGQDFDAFLAALAGFAAGHALRGVAISIAGVVAPETGRITVANIPCADGRALAEEISAALRLPVLVLNDADCFALAEARQGAGRGHRSVFGVILGTGVGGGLVIDGRLVQGAGGYAGEWGHGPVVAAPWDLPCGCGLRGCVDAVGGARGLEKLHAGLHGGAQPATAILADWGRGAAPAGQTVALWLNLIAPPLALVVNVLGASVLPVGGGLSNVPALLSALDRRVRAAILRPTDIPLIVPALCRPEPGLIGAAEAGLEAFG